MPAKKFRFFAKPNREGVTIPRLFIALYPRKRSNRNPFLENFSRSCENQEVVVVHWLKSTLFGKRPNAVILNWAENLWDESHSAGAALVIKRLKRVLVFASLKYHRRRQTPVVLIAHNFFPHGSSQGLNFWNQSGSQLAQMIDGVIHFSDTSVDFFRPILKNVSCHLLTSFPIFLKRAPTPIERRVGPISRLLLVGSDQPRKNLLPLLLAEYEVLNLPIYTTGYRNLKDCVRRTGVVAASFNSHVRWLGRRISDHALHKILAPGTAVVINQPDQLNSSVLWHAVSHGVPIIAPRTKIHEEIQAELGSELVRLFNQPLTPQSLEYLVTSQPMATTVDLSEHRFSSLVETLAEWLTNR